MGIIIFSFVSGCGHPRDAPRTGYMVWAADGDYKTGSGSQEGNLLNKTKFCHLNFGDYTFFTPALRKGKRD